MQAYSWQHTDIAVTIPTARGVSKGCRCTAVATKSTNGRGAANELITPGFGPDRTGDVMVFCGIRGLQNTAPEKGWDCCR